MKSFITEAEWEKIADRRVQARLQVDSRYINAENPEDQALAESEIEWEVERDMLESGFRVDPGFPG